MQKTLQSITSISLIFMLVFGVAHISVSMLIAQGVIDKPTFILFNTLDLPFLLSALIYGTAKLTLLIGRISGKEDLKIPLIICAALAVVLFLIALYFNFILPDAQLF